MCVVSYGVLGLNIAWKGLIPVTCPFFISKPAGVFIQEFALTINHAEAAPAIQRGNEQSQCARGERRSQPYRYRPRKIASKKKANPSRANGSPTTAPANLMYVGHSRPSSNERMVPETAPIAKRMAAALVQRRVSIIQVLSLRKSASPSAIQRSRGKPTPRAEKIIWKASEVPIWARAASRSGIGSFLHCMYKSCDYLLCSVINCRSLNKE